MLGVIRIDPDVAVPPEVWARVREVRTVVYDSIATLSPPEWSFVFTNYVADTPADRAHYERLEELAGRARVSVRAGAHDRRPATSCSGG